MSHTSKRKREKEKSRGPGPPGTLTDHEFGTLVDQVDERFADAQVGVGPPGNRASPQAVLEAPADVVEPPVHVVQPGEGRNARPRQTRLSILSLNLLALALHVRHL